MRRAPSRTLLFANTTGMREPVAATAYLTLMTCSRVNPAILGALRAFRARRIAFGQGSDVSAPCDEHVVMLEA